MCLPALLGVAATGLAGSGIAGSTMALAGLQIASQVVGGIANDRAQKKIAEAQAQSAVSQYNAQMNQQMVASRQMNQAATRDKSWVLQQAQQERATLTTNALEAGFGGNLLNRLSSEINFKAGQDLQTIETNRGNQQAQLYAQSQGMRAEAQSAGNKAKAAFQSNRTNWIGTGFQIANTLVGLEASVPNKRYDNTGQRIA